MGIAVWACGPNDLNERPPSKNVLYSEPLHISHTIQTRAYTMYIYIFTSKNACYRICNFVIVINISYPQLRLPSILFHPVAKNGRFSQVHWRLVQDWTSQGAGGVDLEGSKRENDGKILRMGAPQ